jgi:hypothetical protein
MEHLSYPIGRFDWNNIQPGQINVWMEQMSTLPSRMTQQVERMHAGELARPYRPGGWTKLQVIHHVADSHMNGYIRTKWALTEDNPTIKAYVQDTWATLPDSHLSPLVSLHLLQGLHERWVALFQSLDAEALKRTWVHPETSRTVALWQQCAQYAWHGEHHLAHLLL